MELEHQARLLRQAWIRGVEQYYPGEPKAGYIAEWDNIAEWEREALRQLYSHVRNIVEPALKNGVAIPAEHGGHLVSSVWNILMFQLLKEPKPSYVKHFNQLDEWQQKTDIAMFEAIVQTITQETQADRIS
jgi:hypothetical protein